ncbi:MAG: glycosyltransferase family 39 protein [Candidatus Omnitrophota bacterium]
MQLTLAYLKKRKYSFYILLIILSYFINNFFWCSQDWITIDADMCDHLATHLFFYNYLTQKADFSRGLWPVFMILVELFKNHSPFFYPPLTYFISAIVNIIFGSSNIIITRMVSIFYYSILIISLFKICKTVLNKRCAIISVMLLSLYPAIIGASRLYALDLPLTGVTAFCMYLLIKTDYFRNFKFTLIFSLAAGAGILMKAQVLLFLIGPVGYVLVKSSLMNRTLREEMFLVLRFMMVIIVAGSCSAVWWLPRYREIVKRFHFLMFNAISKPQVPVMDLKILSGDWLLSYAYFLINNLSPVLFIIFVCGLIFFLKLKLKHKGIVLSAILVPYVLFTLITMKIDRFFMPALPIMALISSTCFFEKYDRKKILLQIILGFALFQAGFLSYYPKSNEFSRNAKKSSIFYLITPMHAPKIVGLSDETKGKKNFFESFCIKPENLSLEPAILKTIDKINNFAEKEKITIGMVTENEYWKAAFCLRYIYKLKNPNVKFFQIDKGQWASVFCERDHILHTKVKNNFFDYIIILESKSKVCSFNNSVNFSMIQDTLRVNYEVKDSSSYVLIDSQPTSLGDCSILLFKNALVKT